MNDGRPKGVFDIQAKSKGTVLLDRSREVFIKHEKVIQGNFSGLKRSSCVFRTNLTADSD
jgi:hypothetical protein